MSSSELPSVFASINGTLALNVPPHILQFEFFKQYNPKRFEQIKAMSHFHKLTWKYSTEQVKPEKIKGTNFEYILSLL